MGSALGPHPFPEIVRDFQSVIGREAKRQFAEQNDGALPNAVLACVGGGSNAIGLFYPLLKIHLLPCMGQKLLGLGRYRPACSNLDQGASGESLHGALMDVLQDAHGQILEAFSISAGLDYPGIGPEHSYFHDIKAGNLCACDRPRSPRSLSIAFKSRRNHSSSGIEPCYRLCGEIGQGDGA